MGDLQDASSALTIGHMAIRLTCGRVQIAVLVLGSALLLAPNLRAEDPPKKDGTISGKVTDTKGAPVEGAAVVALHLNTGDASDTSSDSSGRFRLSGLDHGKYEVYVWTRGYRPYASPEVRVQKSRPVRLFVKLRPGN